MMLETSKSISLSGSSKINGEVVVSLNATIPDETGVANITQYKNREDLYDANRTQVRRDVSDFTNMVYDIEDQIGSEKASQETTVEDTTEEPALP